ncbi:MAG: hypothetical protein DRJ03_27600 [Chloroflexi bacterium]|nr:MAG: hypothetical protein DRJ03_27600 [Chloroflexota bacterium]
MGYVADASLSAIKARKSSSYVYFGGYVGQGNITRILTLPPDADIKGGYMELNVITPFNLYINNRKCDGPSLGGSYTPLPGNMTATNWTLDKSCFPPGERELRIDINFTGPTSNITNNFIGGGYIRVDYETNETYTIEDYSTYWFPGIKGIINLYSSFYVPGPLHSISAYLHYDNNLTNVTVYLTVANTTVFSSNVTGEQKITLTNDNFTSKGLDINTLGKKTVPIRMGTEETTVGGAADVILITDRSFSMWDPYYGGSCMEGDWEIIYSLEDGDDINIVKHYCPDVCDDPVDPSDMCHFSWGGGGCMLGTCGSCTGGCWASYGCDCAYGFIVPCYHCASWWFQTFEATVDPDEEDSGVWCADCAADNGNWCGCGICFPTGEFTPPWCVDLCTGSDRYYYYGINGTLGPEPPGQCRLYTCSSDNRSTCASFGTTACDQDYIDAHTTYAPDGYPEIIRFHCKLICERCNLTRIGLAKRLDRMFVNDILSHEDTSLGLVSYASDVRDTHALTDDKNSLINQINGYKASGETCICCAIRNATNILSGGDPSNRRYMLLMSDGEANVRCSAPWRATGDENGDGAVDAKDDAIFSARKAHDDYNITIFSVGFGHDAGLGTLQNISEAGNGQFYESDNPDGLRQIYRKIAEEIINITFKAQKITVSENVSQNSTLYPDSHINLSFSPITTLKYGEISVTLETPTFGNNETSGSFYVPNGTRVIDAKVTSYSGPYWTDRLYVKSATDSSFKRVYWLDDYAKGKSYVSFGDPYIVNIPIDKLGEGYNFVNISTGESSTDPKGGSSDDRAIYTLAVRAYVGYGEPKRKSGGCNWTVEFYDGTTSTLLVPLHHPGNEKCSYTNTTYRDREYDNQSAIDDAVYRLFTLLDEYTEGERDGRLDVKFDPRDIVIEATTVGGIRSLWGPIKVKLILWT